PGTKPAFVTPYDGRNDAVRAESVRCRTDRGVGRSRLIRLPDLAPGLRRRPAAIFLRTIGNRLSDHTGLPIHWSMAIVLIGFGILLFASLWMFGVQIADQSGGTCRGCLAGILSLPGAASTIPAWAPDLGKCRRLEPRGNS